MNNRAYTRFDSLVDVQYPNHNNRCLAGRLAARTKRAKIEREKSEQEKSERKDETFRVRLPSGGGLKEIIWKE
jgi:hypothetical protein